MTLAKNIIPLIGWWAILWLIPILESSLLFSFPVLTWVLWPTWAILGLLIWPSKRLDMGIIILAAWRDLYLFLPAAITVLAICLTILVCRLLLSRLSFRTFWTDAAASLTSLLVYLGTARLITFTLTTLNFEIIINRPTFISLGLAVGFFSCLIALLLRRQSRWQQYVN
jgi:hypothetical protein